MDEKNIIYLILGIFYLVYKWWDAGRKKKSVPHQEEYVEEENAYPSEEKPATEIETMLETLLGKPTSPKAYEEQYSEKEYIDSVAENKLNEPEVLDSPVSLLDSFSGEEGETMLEEQEMEVFADEEEKSAFDLQQAVIFSEILRRPYT